MSIEAFPEVSPDASLDKLRNIVAETLNTLDFMLNGNIDLKNVRARSITADRLKAKTITTEEIQAGAITADEIAANSITAEKIQADAVTADKIDVNELSAISANLGKVVAGILIGAYISTADGTFPRIDFSANGNLLQAFKSATEYIAMNPGLTGAPNIEFKNSSVDTVFSPVGATFSILSLLGHIGINAQASNLLLGTNETMGLTCDRLTMNGVEGFTGSFSTGTQTVDVKNGIITDVF